jgi:hypothetical protein
MELAGRRRAAEDSKKNVDGQVIETWTFRRCDFLDPRLGRLAIMQSGRSTTEPHAHFVFHRKMTNYRFRTYLTNYHNHVTV